MKKIINKLEDAFVSAVFFAKKHMLAFLVPPVVLDVLLIGAYFLFGWENYWVINPVFVVNFIALAAIALVVIAWMICAVHDVYAAVRSAAKTK